MNKFWLKSKTASCSWMLVACKYCLHRSQVICPSDKFNISKPTPIEKSRMKTWFPQICSDYMHQKLKVNIAEFIRTGASYSESIGYAVIVVVSRCDLPLHTPCYKSDRSPFPFVYTTSCIWIVSKYCSTDGHLIAGVNWCGHFTRSSTLSFGHWRGNKITQDNPHKQQ